ncbi:hypothetical protein [Serratia odorifera]|uniref:hypothetical protein n=1 Tax=Serratia odorifera TaxID=618 RepID=UPI0018E6F19A|nr:hypothetical protein [Serratia odorifera]MBJ2067972.1 hypothetical protein [Serratia odorifera]
MLEINDQDFSFIDEYVANLAIGDTAPDPTHTTDIIKKEAFAEFRMGKVPTLSDRENPLLNALWVEFRGLRGGYSELDDARLRMQATDKAARQAKRDFLRLACQDTYHAPQAAYESMIQDALDIFNDGAARTAIGIIQRHVPAEHAASIANRKGDAHRQRIQAAVETNNSHLGYAAIQAEYGKTGINRLVGATMNSTLVEIMLRCNDARKRTEQERRLAAVEAERAELKAFKAATEKRHTIEDAGQDPKELARSMHMGGKSLGAIAKATGRSRSTIQRWVK